ncbi:MAG: SDR family NAD(P)-dependent oxidoreductase [Clostridia bacterium]|nr:SDR family NAD(P)-dependent oxidoreductase [Clostridia bacterium]
MRVDKWSSRHSIDLSGKTVAITGSTGGIGRELCRLLLKAGASLVMLDRSPERSAVLRETLKTEFPNAIFRYIRVSLDDMESVQAACEYLKHLPVDILIHNAGAYSIPRYTTPEGYDNVFQINTIAPYYMTKALLPQLRQRGGRVIFVGSIAHRYSKSNPADIDFSTCRKASLVYGNAKRYSMFSLYELFREETQVTLSVCHPGITLTNITAHYPKWIFALIKYPMKVIFMSPRKAALSILQGCAEPCGYHEWIGPWLFDVWGIPKKRALHSCTAEECRDIYQAMERRIKEPLNNR